jgi:hypothetical protein
MDLQMRIGLCLWFAGIYVCTNLQADKDGAVEVER